MSDKTEISSEVNDILNTFSEEAQKIIDDDMKAVAKETASKLKDTSPKRPGNGDYARSWSSKKQGKGYVVFNKDHYRLTHLLENGHVIRNREGGPTYGRTRAIKHIKPAEEWASDELERRVKNDLSNT